MTLKTPILMCDMSMLRNIGKKYEIWEINHFLAFFVTFSHSYAMYGILGVIFGFSSPENPYFDV